MNRRALLWISVLFLLVGLTSAVQARSDPSDQPESALVYVSLSSPDDSGRFASTGLPVYARLQGEQEAYLLTGAGSQERERLTAAGLSSRVLDADVSGAAYYLTYPMPGRPQPDWNTYGRLLLDDGSQALLRLSPEGAERLAQAGVELRALSLDPKPLQPALTSGAIPDQISPDPLVQAMIDQVDLTTVYSYTGDLSGEWSVNIGGSPYTITTRHTDSGEPIQKATQFTYEGLQDLGIDVQYHDWNYMGHSGRNVIGEITGSINPDDIFIICAHLDDMPTGPIAPGADDNASGSVAVLTAADILSQYQWGCTLRFALWTGEEQGLLGSHVYAQEAYNSGENIVGVINLDMIAWNTPASSPDIDLHADSDLPETLVLAQLFADVVDAYNLNLTPQIIPNGTGASDHASFWQYGYTAILGIEDFGDFNPYYHSPQDLLQHLDMEYYTDFVKASLGTFAHASGCLIPGGIGYLNGHVTEVGSGDPIAAATLTMDDGAGHTFYATTDPSGYYTRTLLPGTYVVTASAFAYLPASVTGVAITTDTVATQDFALELAPEYVISGTVTQASTGLPLLAEVEILDTPLPSAWTDPDTGYYSIAVPQGSYTMQASAAQHLPEERAVLVDHDQTQDFALQPLPCILLVDDDNNNPDVRPYYTTALDNLGYDYNVFDVGGGAGNGPALAEMQGYAMVIWFSGDKYGDSAGPNAADEANLAAYLDGGGRLFLSSQDYLYDFGLTAFGEDYLGIDTYVNDSGDASSKVGQAGDPIGGGLGPYPLSYPSGFADYGDVVDPDGSASLAFRGNNNNPLDVDKDGGAWRTVFFGTSWVPVYEANAANGEELLDRIITWFGGCDTCESISGADFGWEPLNPIAGQTVTFTGTVASGTPPILFEWDLGDGSANAGPTLEHVYATAGDYTVVMSAANACSQEGSSHTVTVLPPACVEVTDVDLSRLAPAPIYPDDPINFSADIAPDDFSAPYTYTVDYGDDTGEGPALSNNDPLTFSHSYAATGTYAVKLWVWNCDMTIPVTDTVQVLVEPVCTDLTNVTIAGETSGYPGVYTFTTSYQPLTATQPIDYLWDNGDITSTSVRTLDVGPHTLTVTATNCPSGPPPGGIHATVMDTHTIVIEPEPVCTQVTDVDLALLTAAPIYTDTLVQFEADLTPDDATKPYTYTIVYGDGDTDAGTSSADPFSFSYTYANTGTYTAEFWAWNCDVTGPITDSVTFTVMAAEVPTECIEVAMVDLALLTAAPIYTDTLVQFEADLMPDDATKPYTYTIVYGDGNTDSGTSSADPFSSDHTYANTGTYTVEFWAWNCAVTEPITDTVEVVVMEMVEEGYTIYLPILIK